MIAQLPLDLWEDMRPVFAAAFPNEAVVAIHGTEWRELANVAARPAHGFEIGQADLAWLMRTPPTLFLHSHPSPPASAEPSDRDTEQQLATGWDWGIVAVTGTPEGEVYAVAYPECWGDGIAPQALVGRTYLWAVRDCWTLVRDFYREQGLPLRNTSRARKPDLYPQGDSRNDQIGYWPAKLGFKPVERHARRAGDLFTMAWRGNRRNHVGVYLDEGRYLHQLEDRTSEIWVPHNEELVLAQMSVEFSRHPKAKRVNLAKYG